MCHQSRALFPFIDKPAFHVSPQTLCLADRVHRAGEKVAVHDDEVRALARFQGTDLVFQEKQVGVVDRVEA